MTVTITATIRSLVNVFPPYFAPQSRIGKSGGPGRGCSCYTSFSGLAGLFGEIRAPMAARTTDHNVHMMTIITMRGSAFGIARAAAKTAAMLRVPIPSDMTLRCACVMRSRNDTLSDPSRP